MKQLPAIAYIQGSGKLFFLCLLLCAGSLHAQHYNFRQLLKDHHNGLASSNVYETMEDRQGYVWIATSKAITRYDGKIFKHYGPAQGLMHEGAFRIFKDSRQRLWFITLDFHLYLLEGERFTEKLLNEHISWVDENDEGILYAGTRTGYLIGFNDKGTVSRVMLPKPHAVTFFKVLHNTKGIIVVSNAFIAMYRNDSFISIPFATNMLTADRVFETPDGKTYLTNLQGIYELNTQMLSTRLVLALHKRDMFSMLVDTLTGDYWIGTGSGAYRFPKGDFSNPAPDKFLDAPVFAIRRHRDGSTWFSTYGDGIYYGNFNSRHFTTADGLFTNTANYVRIQDSTLYVFSPSGHIAMITNGRIKTLQFPSQGSAVKGLMQAPDGAMYALTPDQFWKVSRGIVTRTTDIWDPVSHSIHWLTYVGPTGIYYTDSNNRLMIKKGAEFRYLNDRSTDSIITANALRYHYLYGTLMHVKSADEMYWLNNKGINWSQRTGGKRYYYHDTSFGVTPNDLIVTPLGNMVIATNTRGVDIVRKRVHHFYATRQGLPGNSVKHVYLEGRHLWACTNNGLSRLTLDAADNVLRIDNIHTGNLLISDEVNDLAADSNYLYVATNQGVSVLERSRMALRPYQPPVCIQQVQVNDKDTPADVPLLLHHNDRIAFYFRAMSYSGEQLYYRYRLEGLDEKDEIGTEDNIKYVALPAGQYRFRVYARTVDGGWSAYPAVFSFSVTPPYWQTWWFWLSVALLFLAIVALIVIAVLRANKRKAEVQRRISESELKAIRLHMNPHFIYNTLSSLQSYILSEKAEQANNLLSKFARLIRLIMHYAARKEISLQEEIGFLNMYLELEAMRFGNKFSYTIHVADAIDPESIHIPPLVIQPFVENAIKYGISHREGSGLLRIDITGGERSLYCIVEDNGIGRKKAASMKHRYEEQFESTGIKYTEERLKLLSGSSASLVQITDLYDDAGNPTGTRVSISIPLN